jgi:molybdenum cofactor cytidylyltransferase
MSVAGLILAAGRGVRFGADKRLLKMPDGRTMLEAAIQTYMGLCQPLFVVIRSDDAQAHDLVLANGAQVVCCQDADLGMGHSLAQGARALQAVEGLQGVIIGMADMPTLERGTVLALRQALRQVARPVVPVYQGRLGQPRGLPVGCLPALMQLTGDQGARNLLDWQHEAVPVPVSDAGVCFDVDTPLDFQAWAPLQML